MIRRLPSSTTVTCKRCKTVHLNVPVECDEDGPYAEIETSRCNADGCDAELCSQCDQFRCDSCDLPHCLDHRIEHGGEVLCPVCMELLVEEGAAKLAEEVAVG